VVACRFTAAFQGQRALPTAPVFRTDPDEQRMYHDRTLISVDTSTFKPLDAIFMLTR